MNLGRILPEGLKGRGVLDLTPHCQPMARKTSVSLLDEETQGWPSPSLSPWGTFRRSLDLPRAVVLAATCPPYCIRLQSPSVMRSYSTPWFAPRPLAMPAPACQPPCVLLHQLARLKPPQPLGARSPCEHCPGGLCLTAILILSVFMAGKHCQFPKLVIQPAGC